MFRWLGALVAAASMSWFALLLVTGDYYNEGPVLFTLSVTHGVHRGDIGIAAFWAAGMIGLLAAVWPGRGSAAGRQGAQRTSPQRQP